MNLDVTAGQVRATVERAYGLRVSGPLVDLPQGVHSRAWLAHTDDGDWVVKVSDPDSDPPATLAAQCELYSFLISRGLQVPAVRADSVGDRVSGLLDSDAQYPVTVMRHHQLGRLTPESALADDLRRVAGQIARLHAAMDDFATKNAIVADHEKSDDEWGRQDTGCYAGLVESPIASRFAPDELTWLRSVDVALVDYLAATYPDPASLSQSVLHGDLSFEHVRLLPNGEVYFFDFGDMCWGPVAHEVAQLLRGSYSPGITFDRWSDLRRWFLEGYRSRRVFTPLDAGAIDVFLVNRVVALAKYIVELNLGNPSSDGSEAIKAAYRLAEAVLRGRHLVSSR